MSAGAPAAFNLVDSSGWIEFFTAGANGPVFKPLIEKTEQLLVPTIALFEVHRVLSRRLPPELVDSCLDAMRLARVLDLTDARAIFAAEIGARHRLALADAAMYSMAPPGFLRSSDERPRIQRPVQSGQGDVRF